MARSAPVPLSSNCRLRAGIQRRKNHRKPVLSAGKP